MLSSIPVFAGCVRLGLVTLVNRIWYNRLVSWELSPGNYFFKMLAEGCVMNTFILNAETSSLSIDHLLKQAEAGGLEVRDAQGKVLAIVLSPDDQEAWTYAEAHLDLDQHQDETQQAVGRRGGVTTSQLLDNAASAAAKSDAAR